MHPKIKHPFTRLKLAVCFSMLLAGVPTIADNTTDNSTVPDHIKQLLIKEPVQLENFSLIDSRQQTFGPQQLHGKWSLMFFGYTHCPDICPATMAELDRAADLLTPKPPLTGNIQYIFVTVDPQRDTPKHLQDYLSYFASDFIGLTGEINQLETLTKQIDIKFSKGPGTDENYAMNHSTAMALIDPQGRYYARLIAPHYAEDVAEAVSIIQRIITSKPDKT